jgi:hypothetical protein
MRVTRIKGALDNSDGLAIVGAPSIADPGVSSAMMTELMRPLQFTIECLRFVLASRNTLLSKGSF